MIRYLLVFIFTGFYCFVQAQNPIITSIINDVKIDSLVNFVENISGEKGVVINGNIDTIYSRHKTRAGNELAFKYVLSEFSRYGLQTDSMIFSATGKNALAIQPGSVYPNQFYILCAHYDDMPNLPIAPAADDDGSGVGAVLEAARILSQYEFEYTIIYALWDEEEQGKVGSLAYANLANTNNDSIMGVINLDAIAWDGDNDSAAMVHTKTSAANSLQISDTVLSVNSTYNLGLNLALTNPGATYSDHASFWTNNFGAVLLIEDWTFDPNPHYHLDSDLIIYFNLPYYERMAKLAIASLSSLAIPIGPLSIHQSVSNSSLKVYPNPTQDYINIQLDENVSRMALYNSNGSLVCEQNNINHHLCSMNMENYDSGIYILVIETENNVFTKKVTHWN